MEFENGLDTVCVSHCFAALSELLLETGSCRYDQRVPHRFRECLLLSKKKYYINFSKINYKNNIFNLFIYLFYFFSKFFSNNLNFNEIYTINNLSPLLGPHPLFCPRSVMRTFVGAGHPIPALREQMETKANHACKENFNKLSF